MADIFLARADTALGGSRLCVLKQILPELGHDPQFEWLLIEEAKLAARLTHGNIVQVFDLGREDDRLFIVMEYVEGFDLNQLLRAVSRAKVGLPAEFAILIVRDVLRALDYAHRLRDAEGNLLGLVHRDVSPSNVLISFEGEVKLCDFGIARAFSAHADEALGTSDPIPPQARIAGKSAYMAPEQALGEDIDARADLFAAGIILWELCAGRRLYRGSDEEMLSQARQGIVPPLPEHGLPDQDKLQAVLDRALARRREERFASAQEFLEALEEYAIGAKLMASQLRIGAFLSRHFGTEMIALRRQRELSVRSLASELPTAAPPSSIGRTELLRSGEMRERRWREPGASQIMTPSSVTMLTSRSGSMQVPARIPPELSERELDRSLLGLDLLAEETRVEAVARIQSGARPLPSVPPKAQEQAGDPWIWYAISVLLVLLGLAVYYLR